MWATFASASAGHCRHGDPHSRTTMRR
jgi:hypothetical protein